MATEVRPYLKLRVAELEAVFEASASDPTICQDLIAELRHRKTDKAVALLARVSMATHETVAAPAPPSGTSGQKTRPLPAPKQPSERPAAPETTSAVPPIQRAPARPAPPVTNSPGAILSAWTALEALSPQTYREVGLPLLVHRRCQNPMFDISNQIAYDRQMVYAAGPAPNGRVRAAIGPSGWYDVDGSAESKWCPEEGELVVDLLRQLAAARVHQPDIYVITPFRVVAHEMRKRIAAESDLLRSLGVDSRQWLQERVGTIHTFQGKEAEAVIAVLGAPMTAQHGARRWAASSPNILNVMVSRAKEALYVVGSRTAWSSVGHGAAVASHLPIAGAPSAGRGCSILL